MALKLWYGPLWPLPRPSPRTALTSGLPAPISAQLASSEYQEDVARDIIVSAAKNNNGNVYLVIADASGNFSKDNDGTVVFCIPPGGSRNILQASYGSSRFKMSDYGIDVDNDYDIYFVCGIMD